MANNIPLMLMLTDAAASIPFLSSSATFPFLYDLIFTAVLEHLDFFLDRDSGFADIENAFSYV